jgi:hypothetical protein
MWPVFKSGHYRCLPHLSQFIISLIQKQCVVTHTNRGTDIPSLLRHLITNTPSVQILCPQKELFLGNIFSKNMSWLNVRLLRIREVSLSAAKYVVLYGCATTECCFVSDLTLYNILGGGGGGMRGIKYKKKNTVRNADLLLFYYP